MVDLITGYLVLSQIDVDGHKCKVISSESFKVIKDKQKKIKEVKGKSLPEEIGLDPIELEDGTTEENIYPELMLQGYKVGTTNDGRSIIHAIISHWVKDKVKPYLADDATSDDPLEDKNKKQLGIDEIYIGPEREDVYAKFPETEGQYQSGTDEDENPVMVNKLEIHTWYEGVPHGTPTMEDTV